MKELFQESYDLAISWGKTTQDAEEYAISKVNEAIVAAQFFKPSEYDVLDESDKKELNNWIDGART